MKMFSHKLAAAIVVSVATLGIAHAQGFERVSDAYSAFSIVSPRLYAGSNTSSESLLALLRDWDRAGFVAPAKPSQYRVYGRDGNVTDVPSYNTMLSLIRIAVVDVQQGRDNEALAKIAEVRRLLAH